MIRVLLADDPRLVRAGLRMILRAEPDIDVVGEADDGLQAVHATGQLHPDVVLMDIRMPVMDVWRRPAGSYSPRTAGPGCWC